MRGAYAGTKDKGVVGGMEGFVGFVIVCSDMDLPGRVDPFIEPKGFRHYEDPFDVNFKVDWFEGFVVFGVCSPERILFML